MRLRRTPPSAGRSSMDRFRRERRTTIREGWRDWAILTAMLAGAVVAIAVADSWVRVTAAAVLGFLAAIALVMWAAGGHVSNLTWSWGAEGERRTGALLEKLGAEWRVEHDIEHDRGNWDHVVVGPGGVFVIDSKTYHRPAAVVGDELRCGRIRTSGGVFRGSAVKLKKALEQRTGSATWVQAVVVVHGDFSQYVLEHEKVTYVAADGFLDWLRRQPDRLTERSRAGFAQAIVEIARSAAETTCG